MVVVVVVVVVVAVVVFFVGVLETDILSPVSFSC